MPTNYDDEEEKRRLREQTQTIGVDPGNYEDFDPGEGGVKRRLPTGGWAAASHAVQAPRDPATSGPLFRGVQGVSPAEAARRGTLERFGGYVANPNDTVAERSFGSDWARSMRARGRLSAPSLAEQSLGQARAAQRINQAKGDFALAGDYQAVADSLQQQVDRDKQLEREEMEKWLESQSKNLALSVAERQKHAGELQRLHAEDAALRQDDLARAGIESRERIAGGTNQANIRVAELGLEGTEATALGGVEQARLRGQADVDAAGITAAGKLRVAQQEGQNAIDAANAAAEAAPWAAQTNGGIFNKRTGDVVDKPEAPLGGVTLKPGETYIDRDTGKTTVAGGGGEQGINDELLALYQRLATMKPSDPEYEKELKRAQNLREQLDRIRGVSSGQAGAGAGAARANDFGR